MYMLNLILFPSSYFSINKVDEDLQKEYDAASETGLFEIVLFGYDQWFNEGRVVLSKSVMEPCKAIMRGWMMKPDQYESFYKALLEKNIELITNPKEYRLMHIFPNIYKVFGNDTARMTIYPLHKQIDVEEIKKSYDKFMVKDFVKSVKGTEFPKFFDKSIEQAQFDSWMEVFYKYRGNLLTGGICIKEFLNLKFYADKPNEYRVFYINNEIATISRNSGQGNYTSEPPKDLLEKYKQLESCFYTVDYAELDDGTWKVIEAGDGSVSGLSENQDYKQFFRTVYYMFY